MADIESDLRATVEDIVADATELAGIEREKTQLDGDDPRIADLSREGERLARRMVTKTVAERELAEQLPGRTKTSD